MLGLQKDQRYLDRTDAGRALAHALKSYTGQIDTIIMALPRGGVPVASEVASLLKLPLDIWLVRKLGARHQPELAVGAIAFGGTIVLNRQIIDKLHPSKEEIENIIRAEQDELRRRNTLYRHGQKVPDVSGKTVIIIDDGLATGATMKAAAQSLRQAGAVWITAATPIGSGEACDEVAQIADEVICIWQPHPFYGVSQGYENFPQVADSEVQSYLKEKSGLNNL